MMDIVIPDFKTMRLSPHHEVETSNSQDDEAPPPTFLEIEVGGPYCTSKMMISGVISSAYMTFSTIAYTCM